MMSLKRVLFPAETAPALSLSTSSFLSSSLLSSSSQPREKQADKRTKPTKERANLPVAKKERQRRPSRRVGDSLAILFHSSIEDVSRRGKRQRAKNVSKSSNRIDEACHSILVNLGDKSKAKSDGRLNLVPFSRHHQQKLRRGTTTHSADDMIDSLATLGKSTSIPTKESLSWFQSDAPNFVIPTKRSACHSKRRIHQGDCSLFVQNIVSKEPTMIADSLVWCTGEEASSSTTSAKKCKASLIGGDSLAGTNRFAETKQADQPFDSYKSKGAVVRRSKRTKQIRHEKLMTRRPKLKKGNVGSELEGCTGLGAFLIQTQQSSAQKMRFNQETIKRFVSPLEACSATEAFYSTADSQRTPAVSISEKYPKTKTPDGLVNITHPERNETGPLTNVAIPTSDIRSTRSAKTGSLINRKGQSDSLMSIHLPLGSKITFVCLPDNDKMDSPDSLRNTKEGEIVNGTVDTDSETTSIAWNGEDHHRVEPNLEVTDCPTSMFSTTPASRTQTPPKLDFASNAAVSLRRSTRRSTTPRLIDVEPITDQRSEEITNTKEKHVSPDKKKCVAAMRSKQSSVLRRSVRIRSQPTRLIDTKEEHRLDIGVKQTCKSKEKQAKMKQAVSSFRSRSLFSSHSRGNSGKPGEEETANEAPRDMIIPDTSDTGIVLFSSDEAEDDIFNATPMRNLFQGDRALDISSPSVQEVDSGRRSKRKSLRPERYEVHIDLHASRPDKAEMRSVLKKKAGLSHSKTAKKRVRISNEGLSENKHFVNPDARDQWTQEQLDKLRLAHKTVDPKSYSFWDDVSEFFSERSAFECREKWFSLVKTPVVKQKQKKIGDRKRNDRFVHHSHCSSTDDDIFNATPMRSIFVTGDDNNGSRRAFEGLARICKMNIGSAIKLTNNDVVNEENAEDSPPGSIEAQKPGYKTYLQTMRRNMNRQSPKRKRVVGHRNHVLGVTGRNLAAYADEGDVEMECRLSPGGTLRVNTNDDNHEDYFYEKGDDEGDGDDLESPGYR